MMMPGNKGIIKHLVNLNRKCFLLTFEREEVVGNEEKLSFRYSCKSVQSGYFDAISCWEESLVQ